MFVRAVENIGSFQWRGVPLQAWLYRIAHNVALDHLRRKSAPLDEATSVASPHNPEQEVFLGMEREELLKAMDGLTDAQRETIALRFFGGLTSAETGAVLNRNSGAVREMQSSALKRLRTILETEHSTLELEGR